MIEQFCSSSQIASPSSDSSATTSNSTTNQMPDNSNELNLSKNSNTFITNNNNNNNNSKVSQGSLHLTKKNFDCYLRISILFSIYLFYRIFPSKCSNFCSFKFNSSILFSYTIIIEVSSNQKELNNQSSVIESPLKRSILYEHLLKEIPASGGRTSLKQFHSPSKGLQCFSK